MATDDPEQPARLPPEEAFALVGNESRLRIMRVLGNAEDPLSFTELRNRVGISQGAQFNYHLDKLVGHFVEKTDDGYTLRQAGLRVVEAVLAGTVTESPVMEPVGVDFDCRLCGAPIQVSYAHERLELYCTDCEGQYGPSAKDRASILAPELGRLGGYRMPPAGLKGRTPEERLYAASAWYHLEAVAAGGGVCPRCSAVVDCDVTVCEDHAQDVELCPRCDKRHQIQVQGTCRNCPFRIDGMAINVLIGKRELRRFVAERGIDPILEGVEWGWDYEEEVVATDPAEFRFVFTVADARFEMVTDGDLEVLRTDRLDVVSSSPG